MDSSPPGSRLIYWLDAEDTQGGPSLVNCRFWRPSSFLVREVFCFRTSCTHWVYLCRCPATCQARSWPRGWGHALVPGMWLPSRPVGARLQVWADLGHSCGTAPPPPFLFWGSSLSWVLFLKLCLELGWGCFHVRFWWYISFLPFLLGLCSLREGKDSVEESAVGFFSGFESTWRQSLCEQFCLDFHEIVAVPSMQANPRFCRGSTTSLLQDL